MARKDSSDLASGAEEKQGFRLGGGAIASLTGVGVLVIFMIQNTEKVQVKFLFWKFTWAVYLIIIVSAAFGALVWFGLGMMRRHRRRKARRNS